MNVHNNREQFIINVLKPNKIYKKLCNWQWPFEITKYNFQTKCSDRDMNDYRTDLECGLTLVMLKNQDATPTSNFQPIRLLDPGFW